MDAKVLFDELSAQRGLPAFDFDADGACAFPLENGILHVQCREAAGDVVLTATLGRVADDVRGHVYAKLMAANFGQAATSGGLLALNEGLGEVVYQYVLKADGLTAEGLGTAFDNFLPAAEAWRLHVMRLVEEAAAAEEEEDDDDAFPPAGGAADGDANAAAESLISV